MLEGDFREKDQKQIALPNITASAFKSMLEFCYTGSSSQLHKLISLGQFRIPKEDVDVALQILEASDRFLLTELRKHCEYAIYNR